MEAPVFSFKRIWPLLPAALITSYLFYLDEGYFDFRWMKHLTNWVMFFFYTWAMAIGPIVYLNLVRPKHSSLESVGAFLLFGFLGLGVIWWALAP